MPRRLTEKQRVQVEENLGLVKHFLARYFPRMVEDPDVFQVAVQGLAYAIACPSRKTRGESESPQTECATLAAYAEKAIVRRVLKYLRAQGRSVKANYRIDDHSRDDLIGEARGEGIDPSEIEGRETEGIFETVLRRLERERVQGLLDASGLTAQELTVVQERFWGGKIHDEIAVLLGVGRTRISGLESSALRKLRATVRRIEGQHE